MDTDPRRSRWFSIDPDINVPESGQVVVLSDSVGLELPVIGQSHGVVLVSVGGGSVLEPHPALN